MVLLRLTICCWKGTTDDADATAQRTTLGVVLGTDVQAYDAELAAVAGLTSAADKGIQFTGDGTAATYDLTAAGKALLDDADATAQRTGRVVIELMFRHTMNLLLLLG